MMEKYLHIKARLVYTTQELRKHAEEIYRKKILQFNEEITDPFCVDVQSVLYELRIHQIELEMQNEELRRIQDELETVQKYYFDLYHLAPVGYFTISRVGLIQQVNLTATVLLGISKEKLVRQSFIRFIHKEDRNIFYSLNKQLFEIGGPQKCELRIQKKDKTQFWSSLTATVDLNTEKEPEIRIVFIDISERRQAQIELQASNIELKNAQKRLHGLIAHQQHIKEEERIRIAREIHDELGGVLTGVKANLSMDMHEDKIAGAAPNQHLVNACALLDDAVNTVRKVITELRPSVLDQLGVWAALEWYAEQIETSTGIHCDVEIDHKTQDITLDMERSTAIFRILQESLTNVMRHAHASQVEIRVTVDHGFIRMTVEDNGAGIDVAHISGHQSWGIVGMIERARFLGGDLEITNTSHGTLVTLQLPLERKND
jgi:PAS domain S-box-containing protein